MEPSTSQGENIVLEDEFDEENLMNELIVIGSHDLSQNSVHDAAIVIFDLDTTDLSKLKEICQISARCDNNVFNQYILSDKDISFESSAINKMNIKRVRNDRKLFHNGIEVDSLRPREGLTKFLHFLRDQAGGKVLLAAHNCTFDGYLIIREMQKYDLLDAFQSLVLGFIDTISVFKSKLPTREKGGFNLSRLAGDYDIDGSSFPEEQHAVVNVNILSLLTTNIGCTDEIMKQHAINFNKFIQSMSENVEALNVGLAPLDNVITRTMKKKIAKAGISMEILKTVYGENGDDGVSMLLQEDIGGKPRVTNNKRIIQAIISALSADLENAAVN